MQKRAIYHETRPLFRHKTHLGSRKYTLKDNNIDNQKRIMDYYISCIHFIVLLVKHKLSYCMMLNHLVSLFFLALSV